MTNSSKPRLRFFEHAASQRHILADDRYLYRKDSPQHKLVIIGTGTIGQEHMRVATLLGRARIHGIYDTRQSSLDAAEAGFRSYSNDPLLRYRSLEEACNDPAADALMLCTPNYTHFEVFKVAMQSNKPLFVEKPMATTLADAAEMVRLESEYPGFIQIGLQYRYKAQYVEAFHEALSRRSLGTIKTISMSEYRPPFLDKVGQWNKFNRYTGGTLVEKCCHYFDLLNLMAQAAPQRVFACGGQAVNFLDFEKDGQRADIDDHGFVIIEYANGVSASFTLNMFCPNFYEELVVTGDKGRLVATETFNFHQQQPGKAQLKVELGEQGASREIDVTYPSLIEQSGHHGATFFEHQAFIDRLEGKSVDSATSLQGLRALVVASAAQQSMTTHQAVVIDEFLRENNLTALV